MVIEEGANEKYRQGQTDKDGKNQDIHERVRVGEAGMIVMSASSVSRSTAPQISGTSAQIFGFDDRAAGNSLLVREQSRGYLLGMGNFSFR